MTDDVARLVLADNDDQALALTLDGLRSARRYEEFVALDRRHGRRRAAQPRRRARARRASELLASPQRERGLPRPLLCVLLGHSKMSAFQLLLESDFPDSAAGPAVPRRLLPARCCASASPSTSREHVLRREIVATGAVNYLVNRGGILLLPRLEQGAQARDRRGRLRLDRGRPRGRGAAAARRRSSPPGRPAEEEQAALVEIEDGLAGRRAGAARGKEEDGSQEGLARDRRPARVVNAGPAIRAGRRPLRRLRLLRRGSAAVRGALVPPGRARARQQRVGLERGARRVHGRPRARQRARGSPRRSRGASAALLRGPRGARPPCSRCCWCWRCPGSARRSRRRSRACGDTPWLHARARRHGLRPDAVPASAMGASLPLLRARSPRTARASARRSGGSTAGTRSAAFLGALASETLLVPNGWACAAAALVAAALQLAGAADRARRSIVGTGPPPSVTRGDARRRRPPGGRSPRLLAAAFLGGAALLALEVVWFRFLQLFVFGTQRAFSLMLAVVLGGDRARRARRRGVAEARAAGDGGAALRGARRRDRHRRRVRGVRAARAGTRRRGRPRAVVVARADAADLARVRARFSRCSAPPCASRPGRRRRRGLADARQHPGRLARRAARGPAAAVVAGSRALAARSRAALRGGGGRALPGRRACRAWPASRASRSSRWW